MLRQISIGLLGTALIATLTGCVVNETKPLPKIHPVQAQKQIPADELLDVAVRVFDPGIPKEIAKDEEALAKERIYPEIRQAESRYFATMLRGTLESSGQWGAVRVVPESVEFVDVIIEGKILESTGAKLAIEISAQDSMGRPWITDKRYESEADLGAYKTDAALKARDPFQNVYSQIANDMVAVREKLLAQERRDIRRVTELKFAQDLAPQAMQGYLTSSPREGGKKATRSNNNAKAPGTAIVQVVRLPAANDPIATRIERIRERDGDVVDTVDGYYAGFAEKMQDSYGSWRRTSFDEIEKEQRARTKARTRTVLGAMAVLGSIFVPGQCRSTDYNCRRIESAARTAGAVGGVAAVLSGLKKYSDARIHAQALQELSESFKDEVEPQVVDVEGRTLRLTGTAEEQYREWRKLLHDLYLEDTGVPRNNAGAAGTAAPSVAPAAAAEPAA